MNDSDFAAGWAILSAAFPEKELPPATLELYWRVLAGMEPDAWAGAVGITIVERRFFPRIRELIDDACEWVTLTEGLSGAWAERRISRGQGPYAKTLASHHKVRANNRRRIMADINP